MVEVWKNSFAEARTTLESFLGEPENIQRCAQLSQWLVETFRDDHNLFTCGNGGSHCDSLHFAEELTGRYRKNRRPMGALALGEATHATCTANDFGFQHIFARQLEGLGRKGDLLVAISTSGNSANVLEAVKVAKTKGIRTVGLLGKDGGQLKSLVDLPIIVGAKLPDRIQEMHIKIIHIAIEAMERELFPENYRP